MQKNPKINRAQLRDLSINEQELSAQEMAQVQGGQKAPEKKKELEIAPPPAALKTKHDTAKNSIGNIR